MKNRPVAIISLLLMTAGLFARVYYRLRPIQGYW